MFTWRVLLVSLLYKKKQRSRSKFSFKYNYTVKRTDCENHTMITAGKLKNSIARNVASPEENLHADILSFVAPLTSGTGMWNCSPNTGLSWKSQGFVSKTQLSVSALGKSTALASTALHCVELPRALRPFARSMHTTRASRSSTRANMLATSFNSMA